MNFRRVRAAGPGRGLPLRPAGVAAVDVRHGLDHLAEGAVGQGTLYEAVHDILVIAGRIADRVEGGLDPIVIALLLEEDEDEDGDEGEAAAEGGFRRRFRRRIPANINNSLFLIEEILKNSVEETQKRNPC